ncbi:MAG: M48 family metallopeptidase [Novosphingobium sp.]
MLDWLRKDPQAEPTVEVAGRALPVMIRRLERARRMTMRLAPDGSEVRISMPRWARTAEALAFAQSRHDWLARQIAAVPPAVTLGHGAELPFRGRILQLVHAPKAPRSPTVTEDALHLGGPETSLETRLLRWLRGEALELLTADLAGYCERAGQPARRMALSNARRRWGSCAPDGSIRINWRLIMAPDMVRRSVVAHEVAHLVHFDHSPAFHHCLKELFEGSVHEANRWLKAHGRSLYLPFG